ncbi:MAG: hypothetical protein ACRETL_00495, partial [Gammaproteobacteria bacterium]
MDIANHSLFSKRLMPSQLDASGASASCCAASSSLHALRAGLRGFFLGAILLCNGGLGLATLRAAFDCNATGVATVGTA